MGIAAEEATGMRILAMCLSVCPAFTAYISLTMGQILIKLGENVGTLVRFEIQYQNHLHFVVCNISDTFGGLSSQRRENLCVS